MYLIKSSVEILTPIDALAITKRIEAAGRTCWKSEERITDNSAEPFIRNIKTKNHFSVIEHESISVRIICDRGVLAELSRHRLASLSVESTRYCRYSDDKKGMRFIIPPWVNLKEGEYDEGYFSQAMTNFVSSPDDDWVRAMLYAEDRYNNLLDQGWKPEQARSVLPNSLKTELVMTCNLREWHHILNLRTARAAHPQMREIMIMLYDKLIAAGLGVFFEDVTPYRE